MRGLEVRSLVTGKVIDSDSRVVTVRLREGNAVFKDS